MKDDLIKKQTQEKEGYDLEELKSIKFISNMFKENERGNENESKCQR